MNSNHPYTKISLAIAFGFVLFISCSSSTESTDVETAIDDTTNQVEIIEAATSTIENLSNEAFKEKISSSGGILIDVRTPEEYAQGHIENAINLDYSGGVFESAIDTLDPNTPVLVYCQAGGRSGKARDLLVEKKFLTVYNLTTGYGQWAE